MKYIEQALLIFVLVCGVLLLSACGNQTQQDENENSSETEIVVSEEGTETVDDINYVTDYIGPYVNVDEETMTMFLSAESDNGATVTIESKDAVWSIQGKYNNDEKTISYMNGCKKTVSEDGKEQVEYEDGKGKFLINDDETIVWKESKEDTEITFKYDSEDHE